MPRKQHFQAPFYGAWRGGGFRNDNPDKGTETNRHRCFLFQPLLLCLEMITPIRGRKPPTTRVHDIRKMFRNDNPDKGTETIKFVTCTIMKFV